MGKCNFKFITGEPCGLKTTLGLSKCDFHHKREFHGDRDLELIKKYINLNNREFVDLSASNFNEIIFNKDLLNIDTEYRFLLSNFNKCSFRDNVFNKSVKFNACSFKNTIFSNVGFYGEDFLIKNSIISDCKTFFGNCY